jgi:hypothetical protein
VIAIHNDLVATLGSEAASHSSVTRYLSEAIFISSNSHTNISEAEPQFDSCDQAILFALAEKPFASIRELAWLTQPPRTMVLWPLIQSLGLRVRHFRLVPHLLSHSQKLDRVILLQQLLSVLERQERRSWHDMVTLDESWFYLSVDHELIWLQPDEKTAEREQHSVQSEK